MSALMERMNAAEFFTVQPGAVLPFAFTYTDEAGHWIDDQGNRNVGPALRLGYSRPVVIQAEDRADLVRFLREAADAIDDLYGERTSAYRLADETERWHLDKIYGEATTAIMHYRPATDTLPEEWIPRAVVHEDAAADMLALYQRTEQPG